MCMTHEHVLATMITKKLIVFFSVTEKFETVWASGQFLVCEKPEMSRIRQRNTFASRPSFCRKKFSIFISAGSSHKTKFMPRGKASENPMPNIGPEADCATRCFVNQLQAQQDIDVPVDQMDFSWKKFSNPQQQCKNQSVQECPGPDGDQNKKARDWFERQKDKFESFVKSGDGEHIFVPVLSHVHKVIFCFFKKDALQNVFHAFLN